jgi:hypothetical protein
MKGKKIIEILQSLTESKDVKEEKYSWFYMRNIKKIKEAIPDYMEAIEFHGEKMQELTKEFYYKDGKPFVKTVIGAGEIQMPDPARIDEFYERRTALNDIVEEAYNKIKDEDFEIDWFKIKEDDVVGISGAVKLGIADLIIFKEI